MQRMLIIGPCGAGKSTLARRLGTLLDLPVIHLDVLNWQPGWVMTPDDEFERKLRTACAGDRWIIDGNYSATLPLRVERADTIVLLDFPRRFYLWRVLKRIFTHFGQSRPDVGEGCPEKLDWEFIEFVWNFDAHSRPRLMRRLGAMPREKKLLVFRHPRDAESFVRSLDVRTTAQRNPRDMY